MRVNGERHDWRQAHVWLTREDHNFWVDLSARNAESVSSVLRRLVRTARLKAGAETQSPRDERRNGS